MNREFYRRVQEELNSNRNIFIVMLIKFAYNIIPFLALIAGI